MKPGEPPISPDASAELSALIALLHQTGQRIEELTSGEVDSVADPESHTFLLRRAQEHLRQIEAAKQEAILDALPAHVAVLDASGVIVSVNHAWRRFAVANGLEDSAYSVGVNYLDICDRAAHAGSSDARQAADCIRSVLGGGPKCLSLEYPCHGPDEPRWFLMTVTPLAAGQPRSVVVMHMNTTEHKASQQSLANLEMKYRTVFESSSDAIMLLSEEGVVDINDSGLRLFACSDRAALLHKHPAQMSPPTQPGGEESWASQKELTSLAFSKGSYRFEWLFRRLDGTDFLADVLLTAIRLDGRPLLQSTVRDITERKRSEEALRANEREQRRLAERLELERSRLAAAQRVAKMGSWETDLSSMEVVWSAETHRIHETDPLTFRPTHEAFLGMTHPDDRLLVDEALRKSLDQASPSSVKHRLLMPDGRIKFVEERWQIVFDDQGRALRATGTCQDVTERKMAEDRIVHLRRVHAMQSGISTLIVRVRDHEELFREACRIAVTTGGFRMSLIAVVDPKTRRIVPVASAGKDEVLFSSIKDLLTGEESAPRTMVARAIREKRAVVSNDSLTDPQLLLHSEYSKASVRSLAVLPLLVSDEAVGVLALYSEEIGFFHDAEIKLLTELTDDIAFCMGAVESRLERERAEGELRYSLEQKEALLKEVHHRVKNNLQVITSLLRLESNRIDHPTTRGVLHDLRNRIQSMALLHETLYRSNDFSRVDLAAYLTQLVRQLVRSLATEPDRLKLHLDLVSVTLDLDQATPCGLIVNELVSNALKHAFPKSGSGAIRIDLHAVGPGELRLRVSDDGVGLPPDFDARRNKSLGLQLVSDLARQLHGTLEIGPGPAALFEVTFPPTRE